MFSASCSPLGQSSDCPPFRNRLRRALSVTISSRVGHACALYGFLGVKVRAQRRRLRHFPEPPPPKPPQERAHVGIIGCGNFAFSNIAYHLKKGYCEVIRGTVDVAASQAT